MTIFAFARAIGNLKWAINYEFPNNNQFVTSVKLLNPIKTKTCTTCCVELRNLRSKPLYTFLYNRQSFGLWNIYLLIGTPIKRLKYFY